MRKLLLILPLLLTAPLAYGQAPQPEPQIVVTAKIRIVLRDGQRFESYCGNNEKPYQSLVTSLADTNKTYIMMPIVNNKDRLLGYVTFLKSEVTSASFINVYGDVEPGDIGFLNKLLENNPEPSSDNDPGPPEPEDKENE